MPAPVPAGFTRGALVATGGHEPLNDASYILQYFWQLAGSYGARIAIIPTASRDFDAAEQARALFAGWGANWAELLPIRTRLDARSANVQAVIQHATAYFFTDGNPLRLSTVLGGTPAAQAIRRGHARGKVVAGSGHAGAFLAEHMIVYAEPRPQPERGIVRFAPGLGLTNRVIFVADYTPAAWYGPLCVAVAANPFLLGVGIHANAAVVLHPGNLLEGVGEVPATLSNGSDITQTNLYEVPFGQPVHIEGIEFGQLPHDFYYDIDKRGLYEEENILADPVRSSF